MTQVIPEEADDSLARLISHYAEQPMTDQQKLDSDFDDASNFAKGVWFVIGFAALCIFALWCLLYPKPAPAQAVAPVVNFDASVKSAVAPITTVLTWSSTGAVSCTAGGAGSVAAWSGAVPLSGTRTLSGIGVPMPLTLACTGPAGSDSVVLTWIPPTTNTDGTTLTDLGGYTVYRGDTTTLVPLPGDIAPGLTTLTLPAQPTGTLFYAMDAWANRGSPVTKVRSKLSNVVTKTVAPGPAQTTTKSIQITIISPPASPVLTVTDVTAYEVYRNSSGVLVAHEVGEVPPNTLCAREGQQQVGGITFSRVDRGLLDKTVKSTNAADKWVAMLYARCG